METKLLLLTLVVLATALPVAADTIYVDPNASGADDGTSWTDAFETLAQGASAATAGDVVRVMEGTYVIDDGGAVLTCDNGGDATSPIWYLGSTDADSPGTVTLDGTVNATTRVISVQAYCAFAHITCIGGTSYGVGTSAYDNVRFYDCIFRDSGGQGVYLDDSVLFRRCTFTGNGGSGADVDTYARFIGCLFYDNAGPELNVYNYWGCTDCVFYDDDGSSLIYSDSMNGWFTVNHCTFDGVDKTNGVTALDFSAITAATWNADLTNNVFTRLGLAIDYGVDLTAILDLCVYNGFYDNTTDVNNVTTGWDVVTDAITYADASDYTPALGSAALAAGLDASLVQSGASYLDLGGIQRVSGSGDANDALVAELAAAVQDVWESTTVAANVVTIEGADATNTLDALDLGGTYDDGAGLLKVVVYDVSTEAGLADLSQIGAKVVEDVDANSVQLAAIVADTGELQTNQDNWLTATGFSTPADIAAIEVGGGGWIEQ